MIRWQKLKEMAYHNQPVDKGCGIELYTHFLLRDIYTKYRSKLMSESMCKAYVCHIEKEYKWYYAASTKHTAFQRLSVQNIPIANKLKKRMLDAINNDEEMSRELFIDALELITILSHGEDVTLRTVKKQIKEMEEEENAKKAKCDR